MKRKINPKAYPVIADMLFEINPKAYQACIRIFEARLKDVGYIVTIRDLLAKEYELCPETHVTTVSVILKLYAPEKLHTCGTRMKEGIREKICEALQWKDRPTVNYYQDKCVSYYKIKSFKENVDRLAKQILKAINIPD